MSRVPRTEFHIDASVLAELFGLEALPGAVALRSTLSGHPYLSIGCYAKDGIDGGALVGTVERHPNGSVHLGVKRA